ncbi:hypothetical protein ACFXB3_12540 [Streptomyces sp. NPDC059447]|uniref:hypothetical protein n=1 Tax=Streptomyces sp. NPDC059447 TaxID=3346834 RepID=UPI0036B3EAA8
MRNADTTRDVPCTPVITPSADHVTPDTTVTGRAAPGSGSVELSTRTMWTIMSGTREAVLEPPSQWLGSIAIPYVR